MSSAATRRRLGSQTKRATGSLGTSTWLLALILLLLAVSWAVRLHRLAAEDIWWDEARNIDVAMQPLTQIASAPELDIHPPVYFYVLSAWVSVTGISVFSTRAFSALFGVLSAVLTYRLAQDLLPGQRGLLAGVLALSMAAASPLALAEAQETRMYTFAWTLLSAAILALQRAIRSRSMRRAWHLWVLFVLLSVASLLTHYGVAVVLASWVIWLLLWAAIGPDRRARFGGLALVGLAAALLCLPVVPIALRQIPVYQNANLSLPSVSVYLGLLFRAFTVGEHAPASAWAIGRWLWLLLPVWGALLAVRRHSSRPNLSLLGVWLAGSLIFYYVALTRQSAFNARYVSFALPALWALIAWALTGLLAVAKPLPWLAGAVLVAITAPATLADFNNPQLFHADVRGVIDWLSVRATTNDVILVDQRFPFDYYWQRWNGDPYGYPPATPADWAPAQYLFVDINHIDERLTKLASGAQTIYCVTWFESDTDPRGAVPALLNSVCGREGQQAFRGYNVSWWRCEPPNAFHLAEEFQPLNLSLTPAMTLLEGDWTGRHSPAKRGQVALVTLRWLAREPTSRPLKVSLRLKDKNGASLGQDDRVLLNDRHLRTTRWDPGATALAVYNLPVPAKPGDYALVLVLYDERTLEPLSVLAGSVEIPVGTLHVAP